MYSTGHEKWVLQVIHNEQRGACGTSVEHSIDVPESDIPFDSCLEKPRRDDQDQYPMAWDIEKMENAPAFRVASNVQVDTTALKRKVRMRGDR